MNGERATLSDMVGVHWTGSGLIFGLRLDKLKPDKYNHPRMLKAERDVACGVRKRSFRNNLRFEALKDETQRN